MSLFKYSEPFAWKPQDWINRWLHWVEDNLPTTLTLIVAVSVPFSLDKTTLYLPESDFSAALLISLISLGVFSKLKRPPWARDLPPYEKKYVIRNKQHCNVKWKIYVFVCYKSDRSWNETYHRPVCFGNRIAIIGNNNFELFPFLDSDVSWNEVWTDFWSNWKKKFKFRVYHKQHCVSMKHRCL